MRTVELVSEWDSVPFDGGYAGLQSLSDRGFSGAVTAGPTQLFMLNGTVVGILDGDIEAFEDADGTARAAPHDALHLLAVMQDRAEAPRAQYYTEETPISAVDRTLEEGNFTGYVELSENVLSGDYYLVYHQGRSMSVAWVGSAERLVTDEEAFGEADDEVGIYQVFPADIHPIELPEPPEPSAGSDGVGGGASTTDTGVGAEPATDEGGSQPAGGQRTPDTAGGAGPHQSDEEVTTTEAGAVGTDEGGPPGSEAAGSSQGTTVDGQQRDDDDSLAAAESDTEPPETASNGRTEAETTDTTTEAEWTDATTEGEASGSATEAGPGDSTTEGEASGSATETGGRDSTTEGEASGSATEAGPGDSATEGEASGSATEAEWTDSTTEAGTVGADTPSTSDSEDATTTVQRQTDEPVESGSGEGQPTDSDAVGALETRSIPSLDPERSREATATSSQQSSATAPPSEPTQEPDPEPTQERDLPAGGTTADDAGQPASAAELERHKERVAELEREVTELSAENEELAAERDRLLEELEQARARIQRLEAEHTAAGGAGSGGRELSPAEAIDGTNLFIRYHSKGEATLAKAQNGSADRAAVEENLRLEYHTQFESDDVVVDGASFEAFLQDSIHYRFVDWLVRGLLYEIRDTGHESAMDVVYDALPEVDRAELNGKVSITYTEDGQEHRSQERFDVVVRDRMGNPLVVANINDSRQPATDGQMTDIIRNAERVGNVSDSLSATFLVTNSFFEPEALETAREATSSGLFSRGSRKSFVNLSRKGGYHLCLLEARNKEFHLAVPEL